MLLSPPGLIRPLKSTVWSAYEKISKAVLQKAQTLPIRGCSSGCLPKQYRVALQSEDICIEMLAIVHTMRNTEIPILLFASALARRLPPRC